MLTRRTLLGTYSRPLGRARAVGVAGAAGTDPRSARSIPILRFRRSPCPTATAGSLRSRRSTRGGGVLGRKLEVVSRDDAGKPQDAIRLAGELLDEQKVDILAGGYLSNVGLALSDYALQRKCLYVAGEPLSDALVWEKGNRYCFRLRPSTYMQAAMLVEEAAKLPAKRWVTVAPNYEYGLSTVKWFKTLLTAQAPRCRICRRAMAGAWERSMPARPSRHWPRRSPMPS